MRPRKRQMNSGFQSAISLGLTDRIMFKVGSKIGG
jgi:hypothetical protein